MINLPCKKSKGRQKFRPLETPKPTPAPGDVDRSKWIKETCAGFICPSKANRGYYQAVLEELWPSGHGIPGPHVRQDRLREAIDRHRKANHEGPGTLKQYIDAFRRIRELQGEEGVLGIAREGTTYQLVDLRLGQKRPPRTGKGRNERWAKVLARYGHRCTVCGRSEPSVRLAEDHKIPRERRGSDEEDNLQPLCEECNNFKSVSCRGCELDCGQCCWAFPEKYAPIRLSNAYLEQLRRHASKLGVSPQILLGRIIDGFLAE